MAAPSKRSRPSEPEAGPAGTKALHEIWLRDPFVVPLPAEGVYLLFGTTDEPPSRAEAYSKYPATGFAFYESESLEGPWRGPFAAFEPKEDFWAQTQFWAPEVVELGGKWYLSATFADYEGSRRCQILRSDGPRGPFEPFSDPITPAEWLCLDGHIYRSSSDGKLYLCFCREWLDVNDGEIYCVELTDDLSRAKGEPRRLFSASEAGWPSPLEGSAEPCYVTDGEGGNYCVGCSRSTGGILGPWKHDSTPVYANDGGHCMLFNRIPAKAKDNSSASDQKQQIFTMALHRPNKNPLMSRAHFLDVRVDAESAIARVIPLE